MASGVSLVRKSLTIQSLCDTFGHMDRDLIQSVATSCDFDVNKAGDILADMSYTKISNTRPTKQQNPKQENAIESYIDPNKYNQIVGFIKRGYKIMILMRGLPGSGKTTLAIQLLHDSLGKVNQDEFIFSADRYFWKTGTYIYNVRELQEAHSWNQRRCFASMKRGVSPIFIDNTNIELWEMKAYCVMATQFGYIIEISESCTPWAYNPATLARRNTHGVEKQKIKDMNDRFKKGVTLKELFQEFKLQYQNKLPQFREYPPIKAAVTEKRPITPPNAEENSWKAPQRVYSSPNKRQFPVDYVHKFEMKDGQTMSPSSKEQPKSKHYESFPSSSTKFNINMKYDEDISRKCDSVDQLLNMETDRECNDSRTDDLISFINEHKQPKQTEDSIKSAQIELLTKQLDENREVMLQMMDFIKMSMPSSDLHSTTSDEKITSSAIENKMEVDSGSNEDNQGKDLQDSAKSDENMSTKNLEDLEKENQQLWNLMWKTQTADATTKPKQLDLQTVTNFSTITTAEQSTSTSEGDQLQMDRVNMYLTDKTSPDDFEIIDMATLQSANNSLKNRKSSLPKFDRHAWGLTEEALVSWEIPSPTSPYKPPVETPRTVETREQSTSTTLDTNNFDSFAKRREIAPIIREKKMESNSRKTVTFDKSSMTDEDDLLLKMNLEMDEPIRKLSELFSNVPLESLLDIYEKCGKDFYWTVDLLSNSPDFPIIQAEEVAAKKPSPDTFKFDLNDWNITPDTSEKHQETDENMAKRKQEEEAEQLKKQEEEEALQLKKQEEQLQLKKQLETSVNISKEHYSERVWQIKNAKMGIFPTSSEAAAPEMITVDNETVYISDDNTDSENEDCEENIVEVNLGDGLVNQLEGMFGQLMSGENFRPVVHMPESLARQLHALYLESICRQIENQYEHITNQLKEDEDFAMKLQEEERKSTIGNSMVEIMDEELAMNLHRRDTEQYKNLTPDTLALKLTKQKLYEAFPSIPNKILDELLIAHDNDYKETVETLISSTGQSHLNPASRETLLQPPISPNTLTEMKMQEQYFNKATDDYEEIKPAQYYRDETNQLMERRRELMNKAREHHQKRSYEVALYYSNLAEKALKKAELANQHATQRIIHENSLKMQDGDTLDLHYLFVKSAIATLDVFIDFQISNLKSANKPQQYCYVITGRGNRSENGRAKLKPAVIRRLKKRNVSHAQINPGMLKIKVLKNLPTTNDLASSPN